MKLDEKCDDWETNIKEELLDLEKMKLDNTKLHINEIEEEVDNSIDLDQYGFIECILLLITTFLLIIFLIKNHK